MALREFLDRLVPLDLFRGLKVTGGYFFRRKETVQYPEKRLEPSDRFRGMFGYDEQRCIDCGLCARACPIDIIFIEDETVRDPETNKKKKVILRYDIDVKRCLFCGLCQEACPTEPRSVWLTSKSYEGATYERNEALYFDKERLQSWEGVQAYPGVKSPAEGQLPEDPLGKKPRTQEPKKAEDSEG
jgi:NADH-quinone oxidoreductase subunit I